MKNNEKYPEKDYFGECVLNTKTIFYELVME
jgi:hypothetical protein